MRRALTLAAVAAGLGGAAWSGPDGELTGERLIAEIAGHEFDCRENEVDFLWQPGIWDAQARSLPYVAVIKGKTFESHYVLDDAGRLVQSSNNSERRVTRAADGALVIAQDNGREMTCRRR